MHRILSEQCQKEKKREKRSTGKIKKINRKEKK
jgi:hypothetical protein